MPTVPDSVALGSVAGTLRGPRWTRRLAADAQRGQALVWRIWIGTMASAVVPLGLLADASLPFPAWTLWSISLLVMAVSCWFAAFATRVNRQQLDVATDAELGTPLDRGTLRAPSRGPSSRTLGYAVVLFRGLGLLYATLGLALAANALVPAAVAFAPVAASVVLGLLLIGDSRFSRSFVPSQDELAPHGARSAASPDVALPSVVPHATPARASGPQAASVIPPSSTSAVTTDVDIESKPIPPSSTAGLPQRDGRPLLEVESSHELFAFDSHMARRAPAKRDSAAVAAVMNAPPLRRGPSSNAAPSLPGETSWTGHPLPAFGAAASAAPITHSASHDGPSTSLGDAFNSLLPRGAALIPELRMPAVLPELRMPTPPRSRPGIGEAKNEPPSGASSPFEAFLDLEPIHSGVRDVQLQPPSEHERGTMPARRLHAPQGVASSHDDAAQTDRVDSPAFGEWDVPTTPAPPRLRRSTQAPRSEGQRHSYDIEIPRSPRTPDFSEVYARGKRSPFPDILQEPSLRPTQSAAAEEVASHPTRPAPHVESGSQTRYPGAPATPVPTNLPRFGTSASIPPPKPSQRLAMASKLPHPNSQFDVAYHQKGAPGYPEQAPDTSADPTDVTPAMPESKTRRQAAAPDAPRRDGKVSAPAPRRASGDSEVESATSTTSDAAPVPVTTGSTPPTPLVSEVRWTDARKPRHALPPGPNPNLDVEGADQDEPGITDDDILRGRQKSALH